MDPHSAGDPHPHFQQIDKITLLSICPIFSGLSQWELKSISQLMRLIEFKKDEIIYREGGEAESFYVVVSGRFEASTLREGKKKVLAYLRKGDYFGEMSLLTNAPHSATIHTLSDSLLLELKKDDFNRMIENNAHVSLELSRRLSARLKATETRSSSLLKSDVISIFSSQRHVGRTSFAINLAASLFHETHQKTILLDMSPSGLEISYKLEMPKKTPITQFRNLENAKTNAISDFLVRHPAGFEVLNMAHEENDASAQEIITPLLNALAIDYRFILIDLPGFLDETVFKAFAQSDSLYFVTDSHINNITETQEIVNSVEKELSLTDDKISIVINEFLMGIKATGTTKRELFGNKTCYSLPGIEEFRGTEGSQMVPYVVEEPEADYSRVVRHIARRISNNLVGLVLGSGAALGLAHIGVLKILEREKIPIDIIAGSSIGALVGALYAVGKSAEEIEKASLDINSPWKFGQLLDFNLFPLRALLDGKMVMKQYRKHLGNKSFEDCRIPLKIIGADLSTRQAITFESGPVADAVRVSIAIPAIFNPVFMNGNAVVDGGILSPLPVGALQKAGANKIIAVNVFPTSKDMLERRIVREEMEEKEGLLMKQKGLLSRGLYKMRKNLKKRFSSNVFDILMNTIQTMETEISEIEGHSADVLMRPVVPNASWVDFFKPEIFIRRGEEEAMRYLSKIKALVSHQNL